ncbi:MAG: hypothetical protein HDQ98_00440 [Lachnospiraceae bacterium]|nr:hypothetical protein [Lachnospiraceae bacterium]
MQEQMGKRFISVALVLLLLLLIAEVAGQELKRGTAEEYEVKDLLPMSVRCLEEFEKGTEILLQKASEWETEMSALDENGLLVELPDSESQQPEVSHEEAIDGEYIKELEVYRDILEEYTLAIREDADEVYVAGKWKYVEGPLYYVGKEHGILYYSLENMSNHDNRELIIGYLYKGEYIPYVVYGDWGDGIVLLCVAERYEMTIYEGGTIELIGGGLSCPHQYFRLGEAENVVILELEVHDGEVMGYTKQTFVDIYNTMKEEITEEEYLEIIKQYTGVPAELKWMPLEGF